MKRILNILINWIILLSLPVTMGFFFMVLTFKTGYKRKKSSERDILSGKVSIFED